MGRRTRDLVKMRAETCLQCLGLCVVLLTAAPMGWTETMSQEAHEVIQRLDDRDLYLRQQAFLRLEALREPATGAVVRQHLSSRNIRTRSFSARALAAIEGSTAAPVLIERLKRDRSPVVRTAVLLALEPLKHQHPDIIPAFIESLRDRHKDVRIAAVDVVSRIDRPEAREAVKRRWRRERNRDVRRVLETAMERLGEPTGRTDKRSDG